MNYLEQQLLFLRLHHDETTIIRSEELVVTKKVNIPIIVRVVIGIIAVIVIVIYICKTL